MEIRDYESGRTLRDVDILLSREEAEELNVYLRRLLAKPDMRSVQLSTVEGLLLDSELSITLQKEAV